MNYVKVNLILSVFVIILFCNCEHNDHIPREETPPVTPYWALGHIVWEDGINTQQAAMRLIDGYLDHDIPVDGIIIDSPWEWHYNDFEWDRIRYPDPENMLRNFMSKGVRTLLWMTGNINKTAVDIPNQRDPDLETAIKKEYCIFVNDSVIFPWWKGEGIFLDFTNPDAVRWWNKRLDRVFTSGIYGWKVDNFRLPRGVDSLTSSVGRLSERGFKKYYYGCMYDYTRRKNPEGIIFARPYSHQGGFNATVNKVGLGWCGDFTGDWAGMKMQIADIYKSARAGYGALACEIGGFSGAASSKEQLIRYVQFASMVATMDNGGANGAFRNHLPWYHDEETSAIYRTTVLRHMALRPYIFSTLVDASLGSGHLIRTVSFEQESHQLGHDLFFKAVTSDSGEVFFSLPGDGVWYEWQTGEKYVGGDTVSKSYSVDRLPLFIKSGAVIPLDLSGLSCSKYKGMRKSWVFLIYSPEDRAVTCHFPLGTGTEYDDVRITTSRQGRITVSSARAGDYVFIIKKEGSPVERPGEKGCGPDILNDSEIIYRNGKHFSFQFSKK